MAVRAILVRLIFVVGHNRYEMTSFGKLSKCIPRTYQLLGEAEGGVRAYGYGTDGSFPSLFPEQCEPGKQPFVGRLIQFCTSAARSLSLHVWTAKTKHF